MNIKVNVLIKSHLVLPVWNQTKLQNSKGTSKMNKLALWAMKNQENIQTKM